MSVPIAEAAIPQPSLSATNPLVVCARELASLLRVGLRTVRAMDAAGRLPTPVRIGHSVRWPLDEIRQWIDAGCPSRDEWEARRAARK
jgi:excisionase family DNA binding protein